METLKAFAVEWLDWGAEYFRNNPQEFFTRCKYQIMHNSEAVWKALCEPSAILHLPLYFLHQEWTCYGAESSEHEVAIN